MDFIIAHSRYQRRKFTQAIKLCDQLLEKNSHDQAAWVLKCKCLVKQNYIDELETQEQGLGDILVKDNEKNNLAKVGTSFKNMTKANPIIRPMTNGRINSGFQRVGTGSRAGSKSGSMIRTGRIMTKNGIPMTSSGRIIRLSTASMVQHGQNFFDSSAANFQKLAQRKSKSRIIFLYLFYVQHNLIKALDLAGHSSKYNNYKDPWWKLAVGKCYYHLGLLSDAQKQLQSSLSHKSNIESYLYLSKIYQKQDNVDKSISILVQGTQIHPYQPKLLIAIARIYDQINYIQKSHDLYKRVLSLQNCNIEAVANIASYYFYKDQSQIAIKLYQRLIEVGYDSAEIWNNLGLCCFSNNQYDVFYSCFERAIILGEDNPEVLTDVWYNIGHIYTTLGQIDMAIEAFTLSISYMPENVESLNNLAVIECKGGNIDSAINYAQKSYRQFQNFQAAYNLSIWYFQTNSYEKSYFYNKQAIRIYPQHGESLQLSNKLAKKLYSL